MKFYHIDRIGTLKENETIDLFPVLSLQNLNPLLKSNILKKFEEGISNFGSSCLLGTYTQDIISEWFLEYERSLHFKDKPSRFQSIFAFSTIDDVQRFVNEYIPHNKEYRVFELESDNYFKGDMKVVGYQRTPLVQSAISHSYWNGESIEDLNIENHNVKPLWEYLLVPPVKVIKEIQFKKMPLSN